MQREYIEWVNFWWDNAPEPSAGRVLLIGDSITNGYKQFVKEELTDAGLFVDMIASSRGVEDPAMAADLEYALGPVNGFKYRLIHFNNCLHAGYMSAEVYDAGMRRCIGIIRRLQPGAQIALVTGTYKTKKGEAQTAPDGSIVVDPELNARVLERNAIVFRLADEYGFPVDDLYSVTAGKPEFPHSDGVHFAEAGRRALGAAVSDFIKARLLL